MLATTLVVFSLVATSALADLRNDFTTTYGFTKIMTNCVGDDFYYGVLHKIADAERWCQQEPVNIPEVKHVKNNYVVKTVVPVQAVLPAAHYPQVAVHPLSYKTPYVHHVPYAAVKPKHYEPLLNADDVYAMIDVTKARVSNLTCTLRKLGMVDDYLNINIQPKVEHILSAPHLSYGLKHDLVQGLQQCDALTKCLPLEYSDSVAPPASIKRILAFKQCWKKARLISCMKEDIKRHIHHIDVSPIKKLHPHETDDQTIERMLFVLYGAETNSFDLV